MTRLLAIGLVGLTVVLATAMAQTELPTAGSVVAMENLKDEIRRLEARLERLEAVAALHSPSLFAETAGGSMPASRGESPSAGRPRYVMRLGSVEPLDDDRQAGEELERLRDEADALQSTVDQMERKITSLKGAQTGSRSGSYRGGSRYGGSRARDRTPERKLQAETSQLRDYRRKLSQKNGEIKKLERQLRQPKQLIVGHWRSKVITLRTTTDVSRTLDRIEMGGYLTWKGRRLREDSDSQEWVVQRIDRVDPEVLGLPE